MPAVASAVGRVPGPETKASRVEEPAAMRADRARRLTWIMLLRVVVDEQLNIVEAGSQGNLSERGNVSILTDTWKPIMQGINDIITTIVVH